MTMPPATASLATAMHDQDLEGVKSVWYEPLYVYIPE